MARAITTQPNVFAFNAPPELVLFWRCRTYKALPAPGGVDEQDEGLLRRMGAMANVYDAVKAYLEAIAPETKPVASAEKETRFTRWYNNPSNRQQVSICNRLMAAGVMSKQGQLL